MTHITLGEPLAALNLLDRQAARREFLACCAARRWATEMADGRPYATLEELLNASDSLVATLTGDEIAEALATHPRIGERSAGADREAAWSRREQSGAADADAAVAEALAAGNSAYEQRFGRVFLICASGLSGEQLLAALRTRLDNDPRT
ncbi:MAG: 2-oxo-4-hydroxy-4-carboxy-5-ureidoimidazoline decarboxylase, partial [Haloechinothrix sp.]